MKKRERLNGLRAILVATLMMMSYAIHAQGYHPLTLHYDRPATYFEEAMVIGNGTMGGIVYGGTAVERISLNDITLWTGQPIRDAAVNSDEGREALQQVREALRNGRYADADMLNRKLQGRYANMYQPLGQLCIEYGSEGEITDYQRWLDISDATLHTRFKRDGRQMECEYFASAPDSGIVVRIATNDEQGLHLRLTLTSQLPAAISASANTITSDGYAAHRALAAYYDGDKEIRTFDPDRGIHFRTVIKALSEGSIRSTGDGGITVDGGKEVVILIANATSFNGFNHDPATEGRDYKLSVRKRMENMSAKGYDEMKAVHTADYKALFDRLTLTLGDGTYKSSTLPTDRQLLDYGDETKFNPELETLYFQYGRYLLISCSRTDGVPANLQGLWNEKILPPWSCNYTSNINVEENYWAAESGNLPEMHLALLSWMKGLSATGAVTARNFYGVDKGWCLGHNTDIWATTNPIGEHIDDAMWACWNMGGAWLSTHIWEHYAFTLDRDFLREYYPLLKGAAEFCMGWLIPASTMTGTDDQRLITAPSTSPENQFVAPDDGKPHATMYGGSADIAMIRECLIDTRLAATTLNIDNTFVKDIDATLARLMPYKIGHKGNLQEWYYDWEDKDPEHRHQSHLFGLYPGNNFHDGINDAEALRNAARKTLEIKGDKTTGWSTGWRINLYARLHDAASAYHIFRKLLSYITPDGYKGPDRRRGGGTYPNLLDAHTPFQIDGNFGGCAGVIEMLVQSKWDETPELSLLPACPDRWSDGEVKGIRARGGIIVSMKWRKGRVVSLLLTAQQPTTVRLTCNGKTRTIKLKKGVNSVKS